MEQHEDVVERGAQLVREDFELDVVADHGQHVLLEHDEPLARQPQDVEVELERLRQARRVEAPLLARPHQLARHVDGQPQDLEEHRRQQPVVRLHGFREAPEELLVHLGGRHR